MKTGRWTDWIVGLYKQHMTKNCKITRTLKGRSKWDVIQPNREENQIFLWLKIFNLVELTTVIQFVQSPWIILRSLTQQIQNKSIVGSKPAHTLKYKQDGSYEYKAQFVAKGFSQIYGKDYRETFAPTANMFSIRLLLQITVQYDLLIHYMNIKSAYLNAPLDYEIYVDPPKGFEGKNGNYVWTLKKSLYGIKQSGWTWNKTLDTYLITKSFKLSPVDPSIYVQNVNNQSGRRIHRLHLSSGGKTPPPNECPGYKINLAN